MRSPVVTEGPREQNAEERWLERGTEVERTNFFSDAVFAIAISLLALELRVPEISNDPASSAELAAKLLELWPRFVSFFISFWCVGSLWMAHHRHLRYLRGYDRRVLVINLLFLMWVVLLPFSASLLGEYGYLQIAADIYAANGALAGLTLYWLWRYAARDPRLMDATKGDPREMRYNELRDLVVPIMFLVSIGISFVSIIVAECSWLLILLIRPALLRMLWNPSSA
jgi:uncharacterized membrane protein